MGIANSASALDVEPVLLPGPKSPDAYAITGDSRYVVFVSDLSAGDGPALYSLPIGGGVPAVRISPTVAGRAAPVRGMVVASEGDLVFFAQDYESPNNSSLYAVSARGGVQPTLLASPGAGQVQLTAAMLSPDHTSVVLDIFPTALSPAPASYLARMSGGDARPLNTPGFYNDGVVRSRRPTFTADSAYFIYHQRSSSSSSASYSSWFISTASGSPKALSSFVPGLLYTEFVGRAGSGGGMWLDYQFSKDGDVFSATGSRLVVFDPASGSFSSTILTPPQLVDKVCGLNPEGTAIAVIANATFGPNQPPSRLGYYSLADGSWSTLTDSPQSLGWPDHCPMYAAPAPDVTLFRSCPQSTAPRCDVYRKRPGFIEPENLTATVPGTPSIVVDGGPASLFDGARQNAPDVAMMVQPPGAPIDTVEVWRVPVAQGMPSKLSDARSPIPNTGMPYALKYVRDGVIFVSDHTNPSHRDFHWIDYANSRDRLLTGQTMPDQGLKVVVGASFVIPNSRVSPDGRSVVFYADKQTAGDFSLYSVRLTPGLATVSAPDVQTRANGASDGLVLLRYLLGLRGAALSSNLDLPSEAIAARYDANLAALDVDGDGQALAESDGVMIVRRMFGFAGLALTQGAKRTTKSDEEIASAIDALIQ